MLAVFASAASGMRAATLRLEASASYVANADSRGAWTSRSAASSARAYQPVRVEQTSLAGPGGAGGGTAAMVRATAPVWRAAYQPDAGFADAGGLVAEPGIDPIGETLEQTIAEASFIASLKTFHAAQNMIKRLFDLTD
jgi:flagellar basal body rod protein FlgC